MSMCMCVRMCRARWLGIEWPSGIVAVFAALSMARFMLMGVCWNPSSLIQPSCIENKTKGPAADISMGSLSRSLALSLLLSVHVPQSHNFVTCPQGFCAWLCSYGNDSAHRREVRRRDVKSWLQAKLKERKPIGNKERAEYKRIPN